MKKLLVCMLFVLFPLLSWAATGTSVSRHGVTFNFADTETYGQFVNGDYWVQAPVTITSITPAFDGSNHGWEVDPETMATIHGLDDNCRYATQFDADLIPDLPYTVTTGVKSIVKAISNVGVDMPCIDTMVVLTVVTDIPADNGATVFRPPYMNVTKTMYSTDDLRWDLLPSYAPVANTPSLATVEAYFEYTRPSHMYTWASSTMRPSNAMQYYMPKNAAKYGDTIMRLMLNDSQSAKLPALANFVQAGIDKSYSIIDGWIFAANYGHEPGHRMVASFAATMLDIDAARTAMYNTTRHESGKFGSFHEDYFIRAGSHTPSTPLWGNVGSESDYWAGVSAACEGGVEKSVKDPYGYIDGGCCGTAYQYVTFSFTKAGILSSILMPSLQLCYQPDDYTEAVTYVDRMVTTGNWAQPDPCAPLSQGGGPSGGNPSGCVLDPDLASYTDADNYTCTPGADCGRYPDKHSTDNSWGPDTGQYMSAFVSSMWDAYRDSVWQADAVLTGTLVPTATEAEIVAGGQTLIITLDDDTWAATVGADNGITDAIIAGIDSAQSEAAGWDAVVKANMTYEDVTRTSATVVTITLGAEATYAITANETITVTIPAVALVTSDAAVVATPTFTVTPADSTAPTLSSVDIPLAGTTVEMTFSENVAESSSEGDWNFVMSGSGTPITLSNPSVSSAVITYDLNRTIQYDETLSDLDYTGTSITDTATSPNNLANISNYAGTFDNRSNQGGDTDPPQYVSGTVSTSGTTLTIVFDEAVTRTGGHDDANWDLDCIDFSDNISMTYSSGDGTTTHVFTLGRTILWNETCDLDWCLSGPCETLVDASSNALAAFQVATIANNSGAGEEISPTATGYDPSDSETGVSINSPITVIVYDTADNDIAIDSIILYEESNKHCCTGVTCTDGTADLTCTAYTAQGQGYTVVYTPSPAYAYNQTINVTIDASDQLANAMSQVAWSYETRSPGRSIGRGGLGATSN